MIKLKFQIKVMLKSMIIIVLLILLFTNLFYPQTTKNIDLRKFSFGNAWFTNDTSDAVGLGSQYDKMGVVNANYVYFIQDTNLNQNLINKIIEATELKTIWLSKISTDVFTIGTPFNDSIITVNKSIILTGSNISEIFVLEKIKFENGLYLNGNNFKGLWNEISDCSFNDFSCRSDSFIRSGLDISKSFFKKGADLRGNFFEKPFRVFDSSFDSTLNISGCDFQSGFTFQDLKISNTIIRNCSFIFKPKLRRISLLDTLDLSNTDFEKGVDFRRTYFQNVTTIYLENTFYPSGELYIYLGTN